VELKATQKDDRVHVILRCYPYLDVLDMEVPSTPEEREKCLRIADYFQGKIMDRFNPVE